MSRILHISDDRYEAVEALARERGQTPEEFINSLLDEAWEQACAKYDAAFEQDASWLEGAREALAQLEAGNSTIYPSTEAFFAHLGASEEQLEAARRLDTEPAKEAEQTAEEK